MQLSAANQLELEQKIPWNPRRFCEGVWSDEYEEENMSNADENHFIIKLYNGKTLVFSGDETVQYAGFTCAV